MKRMLCSLVLLTMISATGLLVGSKSASAASIMITDLWEEFEDSKWKGSWEGGEYGSSGPAELYLARMGDNNVRAEFSIHGSGVYWEGDYKYWMYGTVSGNMIDLKRRISNVVLWLSGENGDLVLKGSYNVIAGPYAGQDGTYYFKKIASDSKQKVFSSKVKVFSSKVIDLGKTTKVDFLTKDDEPIHLGDNRGAIDDIPGHLRNLVPPKGYGWRFTLDKIPSRGAITVAVFSVAPPRYRCDTMVRLNGKNLANLAMEAEVGSGITTTKTISVDKTVFKLGRNELTISEAECVGYDKPVWNDSLIHAVRLEVEY